MGAWVMIDASWYKLASRFKRAEWVTKSVSPELHPSQDVEKTVKGMVTLMVPDGKNDGEGLALCADRVLVPDLRPSYISLDKRGFP